MDILKTVGWKKPSKRLLDKSLKNSYTVKYVINGKPVGMARLVIDYGYIGLIADVVIKTEYQGKGIGTILINNLLDRAKSSLEEGEALMIQLLAEDGKRNFY